MCEQTLLGFCVTLKKNFSNTTTFTVINKYFKGAVIQIATVFRPIFGVASVRVLTLATLSSIYGKT